MDGHQLSVWMGPRFPTPEFHAAKGTPDTVFTPRRTIVVVTGCGEASCDEELMRPFSVRPKG